MENIYLEGKGNGEKSKGEPDVQQVTSENSPSVCDQFLLFFRSI